MAAPGIGINAIEPFLGYGGITARDPVFTSNYNSLQVSLNRRLSHGLQVGLAYTWSKLLTTNPIDRGLAANDTYNLKQSYGLSSTNTPQMLSINYVYQEPFFKQQRGAGWVLGGWGALRYRYRPDRTVPDHVTQKPTTRGPWSQQPIPTLVLCTIRRYPDDLSALSRRFGCSAIPVPIKSVAPKVRKPLGSTFNLRRRFPTQWDSSEPPCARHSSGTGLPAVGHVTVQEF